MKIKEGVKANGLRPEILLAIIIADKIWSDNGQNLVITSITDGTHSANSRHYIGMAVDFRTRYFDESTKKAVFDELKSDLGPEYKVVWHSTHIHVQFNGSN